MGLFDDDDDDVTYSISAAQHDDIILQCFNHKRPRVCSTCPAHPDHGGQCCFGDPGKFQPMEKECKRCTFNYECEQNCIDAEAEYQYSQSSNQAPSRFRKRRGVATGGDLVELRRKRLGREEDGYGRPLLTDADAHVKKALVVEKEERKESEAETMFQRFMKDVIWGAMQGAFEMALAFLRHHRLP